MTTDWKQLFNEALRADAPRYLESVERIEEQRQTRTIDLTRPTVIHYEPDYSLPNDPVPPGTISLLIGYDEAEILERFAEVYNTPSKDRCAALSKDIESIASRVTGPLTALRLDPQIDAIKVATSALLDSDAMADFRYRGKVLIHSLSPVLGLPFIKMDLPYNGGPLEDEEFTLLQYLKSSESPRLDAVVVIRSPNLTEVERQALAALPANAAELNIGNPTLAILPTTTATILLVAVIFATPTITACGAGAAAAIMKEMNKVVPLEEEVLNLGPVPTAAALLAARERAFSRALSKIE